MNELRWILITASIVLLAVIYLHGRRKGLAAARIEPTAHEVEPPQLTESAAMRERRREAVMAPVPPPNLPLPQINVDDLPEVRAESEPLTMEAALSTTALEQLTITQPLTLAAPSQEKPKVVPVLQAVAKPTLVSKPRAPRKIVALRVAAGKELFRGERLKDWLWEHGLRHGKYDIYHRYDERGDTLFSIASMVEPGAFDRETMIATDYAGVSMFLQLPSPVDGVAAFDEMLACARELQSDFVGNLYGERNAPLTAELAERMREAIADFQHLVSTPQARA